MTQLAPSLPTLRGTSLAIMLYGSQARGNPRSDSDIDILQLVESSPSAYSIGSVNVSQYKPSTMRHMAHGGSLFIHHLRTEGLIIEDSLGILKRCLDEYRPLKSLNPMLDDIVIAAKSLDLPVGEDENIIGLVRLGVYLLRTTLYIQASQQGLKSFDVDQLLTLLDCKPGARDALNLRFLAPSELSASHVAQLHEQLEIALNIRIRNELGSLEALALSHSRNARIAPLLENVLMNLETVDYSALTLPPF